MRTHASACLKAWGAARLEKALNKAEWMMLLTVGMSKHRQTKAVLKNVYELLWNLLRGPNALRWIRDLHILRDERYKGFLHRYADDILPRLMIVADIPQTKRSFSDSAHSDSDIDEIIAENDHDEQGADWVDLSSSG